MTRTPSGTPIGPEHIGYRVQCVKCGVVGEIDDVTLTGEVIIRHNAVTWCAVGPSAVLSLEHWKATRP